MVEINGNLAIDEDVIDGTISIEIESFGGMFDLYQVNHTEIDRIEAIKLVNTIMSAFDIDYKEIDNGN